MRNCQVNKSVLILQSRLKLHITALVCEGCLVETGNILKNSGLRKWPVNNVAINNDVLFLRSVSQYEEFSKWSPKTGGKEPLIAWKNESQRFRNRFGLKIQEFLERLQDKKVERLLDDLPPEDLSMLLCVSCRDSLSYTQREERVKVPSRKALWRVPTFGAAFQTAQVQKDKLRDAIVRDWALHPTRVHWRFTSSVTVFDWVERKRTVPLITMFFLKYFSWKLLECWGSPNIQLAFEIQLLMSPWLGDLKSEANNCPPKASSEGQQ